MNNNNKQNFVVMAIPCNRGFCVSGDKAEEFKNQRANPDVIKKVREAAELFRNNNMIKPKGKLKTLSLNKK